METILKWITFSLIALTGFSIQINSYKFEWLGVLEVIYRILFKR